jgi:hypothetical protein
MTQVSSAKELEKCLNAGNKNRHVGETLMNAESSRSHCIFTIYVEMMDEANTKNKKIKAGKLNLVDLAVCFFLCIRVPKGNRKQERLEPELTKRKKLTYH